MRVHLKVCVVFQVGDYWAVLCIAKCLKGVWVGVCAPCSVHHLVEKILKSSNVPIHLYSITLSGVGLWRQIPRLPFPAPLGGIPRCCQASQETQDLQCLPFGLHSSSHWDVHKTPPEEASRRLWNRCPRHFSCSS